MPANEHVTMKMAELFLVLMLLHALIKLAALASCHILQSV
jgi:hypothetical protein